MASLPYGSVEIEEAAMRCAKCGDVLCTVDPLSLYLGQNGPYFCDPETMYSAHKIAAN